MTVSPSRVVNAFMSTTVTPNGIPKATPISTGRPTREA